MKNTYIRAVIYGFLTWLIPFLSSFVFYNKDGGLSIEIMFFKSIMIVIGSISATFLLVSHFKRIDNDYLKQAIIVGFIWLAINIGLDLLVLLPMSDMSLADYFMQIGLRYLIIPVMAIMIGKILSLKSHS